MGSERYQALPAFFFCTASDKKLGGGLEKRLKKSCKFNPIFKCHFVKRSSQQINFIVLLLKIM